MRTTREVLEGAFEWNFFDAAGPTEVGVDAYVEVVGTESDDDLVTGRVIALQIKDGSSQFEPKRTEGGWRFNEDDNHEAYWLAHSLPVIVVLVNPRGEAWWGHFKIDNLRESTRGARLDIAEADRLDESAKAAWVEIAGTFRGVIDTVEDTYLRLPGDTVRLLRRAAADDRLASARLAHRLAVGSPLPGDAVKFLLKTTPTWIMGSPAEQELWMAVASYAADHELDAELTCSAFEAAAEAGGERAARAHAYAGLTLLFADQPERARNHLEAARDGGQVLLADFGLAALEVAPNTAPIIPTPDSVASADDEQLDSEPTLLNFLGEMAKRRGDFDDGIAFRRRAMSEPGSGSTIALELARELYQRATREGRSSGRDIRDALGYAQAAVVDRRRWTGPSAAAVEVVAQILLLIDESRQAISETTSVELGGRALPGEADDPRVIRVGALAALSSNDEGAWQRYLDSLGQDDELRTYLQELRRSHEQDGEPDAEDLTSWERRALEAKDDATAAAAIARLARLGVWSPRAEEMAARDVLPEAQLELLRATFLARKEPERGRAELRALANSSPLAAVELVYVLEEDDIASALAESRVQFARWPTWELADQQIHLLRRLDDLAAAWDLALVCVRNSSYSAGTRQRIARWLTQSLMKEHEYDRAAEAAEAGLDLSNDEDDLAWILVNARYVARKLALARSAIDRWGLAPATDQEIGVWIALRQGTDLSPKHARTLLDLVNRLAPGPYRNRVRAFAIREILTPGADTSYPTSIRDAACELAIEAGLDPEKIGELDAVDIEATADEDSDSSASVRSWQRSDVADHQALLTKARSGLIPVADLALAWDRPYTSALIDNPAGMLVAADVRPALRAAGVAAARSASESSEWVLDLSTALALVALGHDGDVLQSEAPTLLVPTCTIDDVVAALDQLRGVPTTIRLGEADSGGNRRERPDPERIAHLRQQAKAIAELVGRMSPVVCPTGSTPFAAAVELALQRRIPFWCDDSAGRQLARGRRLTTFSSVDLLEAREPAVSTAAIQALARINFVDLPLAGIDLAALAEESDWRVGPVHVALASPGLWAGWGSDWPEEWRNLCHRAVESPAESALDLSRAAIQGATLHSGKSRAAVLYAGVAAIMVARMSRSRPFDRLRDYLAALAGGADPRFVPPTATLLNALVAELAVLGVDEPAATAVEIIGQVPGL